MSTYIQIGAGAGDLDSRSNYNDGFTKYVKNLTHTVSSIILIEPNPVNIPNLKKCWLGYTQAQVINIGVTTKANNGQDLIFYYAKEDGPHYQVTSVLRSHVEKHYPVGDINTFVVKCYDLETIIKTYTAGKIELLAIDIEGIDAEIILDTDWSKIDTRQLSFESLHMGHQRNIVNDYLNTYKYFYSGIGLDHNGVDSMYTKT
jgi:FkbM family methyltransferase